MSLALTTRRAALFPGLWVRNDLWKRARAVPSLDLRFADSKSLVDAVTGQSLVTFSRASSATFVGSDGLVQTASTDVPRFDHSPTTGESLGLLVEEARTNLLVRSEEFDNASWNSVAGSRTITANSIAAPDGSTTADTITADGTNLSHFVSQAVTLSAVSYSFSVFAKAGTETSLAIRAFSGFGGAFVIFNLSTGAVSSSGAGGSGTITPYPNGWYRCTMVFTPLAASSSIGIYLRDIVANTASTDLYLWAAQLEAGAFPTSYIPTTTAAVTRAADVVSITGSAFSSWYRQDEGSVYWEGSRATATGFPGRFSINDNTAANAIVSYWDAAFNSSTFEIVTSSTAQMAVYGGQGAVNTTIRSAFGIATNNAAVVYGGLIQGTDLSVAMPAVTRLVLGNSFSGTIRRLTYWPRRLDNSILQSLTQ